jgi:uncharacterized ion transporter superfamily protein YfcC
MKKIPNTYVIVFLLVAISAVLTWIIPGGEFARQKLDVNGSMREVIVSNSFQYIENQPQTWQIFSSLFDGFVAKADIIVFILIIGGAFWIMNDSKAIDVGIFSFLKKTRKLERYQLIKWLGVDNVIIVSLMLLFSVFGAVFGMSEETIAFVIIFVPLSVSMGYDSITGLAMCFIGAGLGFAGAMLNPFTIGIAQGLSHLPLFSGIEFRFFAWVVINLVGITYILWYVSRIRKNPKRSPVYDDDAYWRNHKAVDPSEIEFHTPTGAWVIFTILAMTMLWFSWTKPQSLIQIGSAQIQFPAIPILSIGFIVTSVLTLRKTVHYFILNLLIFTILFLIIGVMGYKWYVMEIATLFLVMGISSGFSAGKNANDLAKLFLEGSKDIFSAALIVGLAGGIIIILNNGKIIDTLLFYASESMSDMGKFGTVSTMYVIQTFINIFIPSGSAKAALTMPIMSQFSDLVGLSRQATVMAYQFGDGFTNMITPTSGVLMGVLAVARIPYEKWFKWVLPFMIILIILGWLLLIPTVSMQLNGF